jgi:RNA-directed DNA polymerase
MARPLRLLPGPRVLTHLEAWIRRRLRSYLWRQWQNRHDRFNKLRRRGAPKFQRSGRRRFPTGFWRMYGHPAVQQALRNHYFYSLGPPTPCLCPSSTRSNRGGT